MKKFIQQILSILLLLTKSLDMMVSSRAHTHLNHVLFLSPQDCFALLHENASGPCSVSSHSGGGDDHSTNQAISRHLNNSGFKQYCRDKVCLVST